MRKLAFLCVAFALVAVSFYGCDESYPTEPDARSASTGNDAGPQESLAAASFDLTQRPPVAAAFPW